MTNRRWLAVLYSLGCMLVGCVLTAGITYVLIGNTEEMAKSAIRLYVSHGLAGMFGMLSGAVAKSCYRQTLEQEYASYGEHTIATHVGLLQDIYRRRFDKKLQPVDLEEWRRKE